MNVRIGPALAIALLTHAGAYAIILVSTPEKADIQIQGGSISISLMPTDMPASDESGTVTEEAIEPDADDPSEVSSVEPPKLEPVIEPISEPEPVEPELTPEPESVPEPEPEEAPPEPEPAPEVEPAEPEESASTSEPTSTEPSGAESTDSQMNEPSSAETETSQDVDTQSQAGAPSDHGPAVEATASSAEIASTELGNAAADNYNGALMRHMRKARKFDTNARRSSKISITIDANGYVLEVRVLRASGDKTWDRRVVKELKRIAPYPAPPSGETHSWSFDAVPK
ncbi:MAG: TonB family protein [Pseudomonadota bacterium]